MILVLGNGGVWFSALVWRTWKILCWRGMFNDIPACGVAGGKFLGVGLVWKDDLEVF